MLECGKAKLQIEMEEELQATKKRHAEDQMRREKEIKVVRKRYLSREIKNVKEGRDFELFNLYSLCSPMVATMSR